MSDSASSDRTVPAPEPPEKPAEADLSQAAAIPIGEETLQASELAEAEPLQKVAVPVDESVSGSGAPIPPGKRSRRTIALIGALLLMVILLGGSGIYAAVYFATRPQPSISLASAYRVGFTPVGATGTTFHLTGQKFTSNSVITFLLDGAVVAGSSRTQSNDKGDITSTLTVTSAWSIGRHTITARDAAGFLTARGVAIMIVAPGRARTPGPYGAPTDSASGTIVVTVTALKSTNPGFIDIHAGKPAPVSPVTLNLSVSVTGASNGGTVCASNDDGKRHTQTVAPSGNAPGYTETFSATCSGTYQGGRLTYTETFTRATITYDLPGPAGMTCTLKKPYVANRLEGSFTSPTAISGTYSSDPYTLRCTSTSGEICRLGADMTIDCQPYLDTADPTTTGTWTGEAAMH